MMRNNFKIAITGGIGSGKSTVSKFIKQRGFNVISCDDIYRELLQKEYFLKELAKVFGDRVVSNGKLNRKYLSEIVFSDSEKLELLNRFTHPAIMRECFARMKDELNFCEIPLLFESGYQNLFDNVIVVLRDRAARITAIKERDGLQHQEICKRIESQFNYDIADFAKYYVIHNDCGLIDLQRQTLQILDEITIKK